MSFRFATYQIAELARDVEDQSQMFYRYLVRLTNNELVKTLFNLLAGQEEEHRVAFENLAEKYRYKGDLFEYSIDLHAIISRDIKKLEEMNFSLKEATCVASIKEAFALAIKVERDVVLVYKELRSALFDDFCTVLDAVIKTEENHLNHVQELQVKLIKTGLL